MAEETYHSKIKAKVLNEKHLNRIFTDLAQINVARHEISLEDKDEPGRKFVSELQHDDTKKELYLRDDFGWLLGFSFSIPFFLSIIVFIFLIGDVQDIGDNFFYGVLGAFVGTGLGFCVFLPLRYFHKRRIENKEKKGGFLVYIQSHSVEQAKQIVDVLKKNQARNIKEYMC